MNVKIIYSGKANMVLHADNKRQLKAIVKRHQKEKGYLRTIVDGRLYHGQK